MGFRGLYPGSAPSTYPGRRLLPQTEIAPYVSTDRRGMRLCACGSLGDAEPEENKSARQLLDDLLTFGYLPESNVIEQLEEKLAVYALTSSGDVPSKSSSFQLNNGHDAAANSTTVEHAQTGVNLFGADVHRAQR